MNENTKKSAKSPMQYAWKILLVLLCIGLLVGAVSAAPTTSVEISRIAADGTTVLANETVTFAWMKENLEITGDGKTHYGHQGPVFADAKDYYGDPWDPEEKLNTDDAGALRGTSILDLASLVGGIPEGSTVKIIARDGLSRTFSSSYILSPKSRMGPLVLVWEVNGVDVSAAGSGGDASDGMRIYFFADDGVFGNYDMLQTIPENERYNYSLSYPSTRGLSVQSVDRIQIYTSEKEYTLSSAPTPGDTQYLFDGIVSIKKTGAFTETINDVSYEIPWYSPAGILKSLDFDAEYRVTQKGSLNFNSFTDLQTGKVYTGDYINAYNAADLTATLPVDAEILPGDVIYIQFGGDKYKIEGSTAVIRAEVYAAGKTATWPLFLNGAVDIPLDKEYFEADASTHSRVTWTDGNGDVWSGVPLRVLVGMTDDIESVGVSHYTFNSTRAAAGYTLTLTNGDGTTSAVNANFLPATRNADKTYTDDYLIADTLNGVKTALTFVGSSVPAKLTDVRSIDMDVSAFEPETEVWSIDLFGRINGTLADTFLYQAVDSGCAPTHNVTYTDSNGDVYYGMGMSTILGWVDDEHPHSLASETLAGGVTITFANDAGQKTTVDSDLFKDDTKKAIIAVYKNGEKITPTFIGEVLGLTDRISGVSTITFTDYRAPPEIEGLTIIRKTADGTILNQTYISWQEMRDTFPVIGDGTYNYSIQGPIMPDYIGEYGNWDENEQFPPCGTADDPRFKVNDQVKGTAIVNLTDLVGGMDAGDQFKIISIDGRSKTFTDGYRYLYSPDPKMGTMFLAWSDDGIDGPAGYDNLFRLYMTSDDNIFSLWDMHESMAEDDWGFYAGSSPTPADFSVYKINKLEIIVSDIDSGHENGSDAGYNNPWEKVGIIYEKFLKILFSIGNNSGIHVNSDRWSPSMNHAADEDTTYPEGNIVTIKDGDVVIPAADISGSDVDVSVPGSSLIGVLSGIDGVGFYKGGNQGAYFNLDSYDGHTHKKPTNDDIWHTSIDGAEVTESNWTTVSVSDGQIIRLFFDEVSTGESYEYLFTAKGGAASGWSVKLINGETETTLTQIEFETLAKKYSAYNCTDEDGIWKGVPLYVLAGIVDDEDASSFNEDLAKIGYSIRITDSQENPYSTNFDSALIANDNTILAANTLNGDPVPELTSNGKPCAPLQMKGVAAGQLIGNIGTIELIDVPEDGNLLFLSGKMERYLSQDQYDNSDHHFVTYGGYEGMPLYTLVSTVDDVESGTPGTYSSSHFTLNTSIISTSPYTILITNTDGQTREIASSEIASAKTGALNYIIAQKDDSSLILTGNSVSTIFENVRSIELKGDAYQGEDWYILLKGPEFGVYLSKTEIEEAVACDWHYKTFTDPYTGEVWSGMTLASLVGYVDDSTMPIGSNHGGSFNLQLAQNGYTIILTAADGYSAEVDSKDLADNKNGFIIANKVDGQDLFISENLKESKYPLRLVGSETYLDTGDAKTSKFTSIAVGGLVKIELKEFAPEAESPTLTIEKYDSAGNIVASEEVLWSTIWSDPTSYPVIGDGVTTYSFQGLVMEEDGEKIGQGLGWDLEEKYLTGNYKVSNAVKGTAVQDLTDIVGGMNATDEIKFICSLDGWTTTLNYSNIYTPTVRQGTAFLAWYADGKTIPEYSQGPRLFFTSDDNVFSHADMYYSLDESYWHYNSGRASAGGLSAQMVDVIKIIPTAESWTIGLNGAINETIDKGYFEAGLTCTFANGTVSDHQAYYTDAKGRVWAGMPLWILTGFVDDENSHVGNSYNRTLALEGYNITVVGDDGSTAVISSRDAFMNNNYIVANTLNGALLGEDDDWPLRLVGANVTGAMQIKGIQSIDLDLQPAAEKELEYDSTVVLRNTTLSVDVSGKAYDVSGSSVLGVILESGLKPVIGTKKWDIAGILLFDGLVGYENDDHTEWVITVNNETTIDGYNDETKSVAVNIYEVKPGDVITGKFIGNDGVTVSQAFNITVT